ncbi:hypothetical protein BKK80_11910 [Cupriavidus malaysiensis]|uniref:Transmembrane protein n=2 Tax=Burkholderiaceae TaxID=119060 RepID=A0ABM6F4N8_9BURK|nr:hypothetical protein BKK80_11910 [Cupriavidus malaysiensis]
MKVNRNRPWLALRRAAGARLCFALAMTALFACPGAQAQSAGISRLLHGGDARAERLRKHEGRRPPERERRRFERDNGERSERGARGDRGERLSPDERRRLRQNLYDLGREMYGGA